MFHRGNRIAHASPSPGKRRRGGLTVLEYVGCAVAVVGGVWLGSLYVGVDLEEAAYTALSETEMLDRVPSEWRPAAPEGEETAEQQAARVREELRSLDQEISALSSAAAADPIASDSVPTRQNVDPAARDQTLSYWQAINQIASDEARAQGEANAASRSADPTRVFAIKARACRLAGEAIKLVQVTSKVDPGAATFARQLANWYESGAALYDRAVQIWESPVSMRERANEQWKRANLQHQNEAQLLKTKGDSVRKALARHYGAEFSPFAEAQSASPSADERLQTTVERQN